MANEQNLKPFKKGHDPRRNLEGRPIGARSFENVYKDALTKIAALENITPEDLEDQIIAVAIKAAKKGDYRFYKDTLDRLHGSATQKTDITSDGESIVFGWSNEE